MKITKLARLLLIAVAAVMVFSLFACGETPEENETTTEEVKEPVESTGDKTPDEPENTESSDVAGGETTESKAPETAETEPKETETTEAPACDHAETEVDAGKAATCTENGLTEGSHCTLCGAVVVAQNVIPAAHTLTNVQATAPTCTEDGVVAHANCSVCGKNFDAEGNELATIVDPAKGHNIETVAAAAPTCSAEGNEEYKKCSNCGAMWDMEDVALEAAPSIEIVPSAHKMNDVAYMAPTTAEAGVEAHSVCEYCGLIWSADGVELGAVPTIAKIVPTTEKYWGAYELSKMSVNSSVGSTFKPTAMATDRTYVRFERDGTASRDGAIYIADNKESTEVTGQYLIFKYRTDHVIQVELFATTEGGTNGSAHIYPILVTDEKWHIVVINLADQLSAYVIPEEDGSYVLTWSRIDIFDSEASEGYFDIAWMVTCDDPSEVVDIMQEGDIDLCPHILAAEPEFENLGEKHAAVCAICGDEILYNHSIANTLVWNAESKTYTGTCVCGASVERSMLYVTEASCDPGQCKSFVPEVKDGFVRYTNNGTADPFVHFYVGGNVVTGKYVVIKYRVSKAGLSYNNSFVGSVAGDHANAYGGCDSNSGYGKNGKFVGDGEWHYLVIEAKSDCFKPNEDGTYSCRFFRLGLVGFSEGDYIDIDEVAFASELDAAENYAYTKETVPPYKWCIDNGANTGINDATAPLPFTTSADGESVTGVVDMKDSGAVSATNGVAVGGWLVTPGGTKTYKYRVTVVDGVAVENPTFIDGWTAGGTDNPENGIVKQGTALGWTSTCGLGSAWQTQMWINLLGYEGKTVTVEIVAVTNYGAEVVFLRIENINVAVGEVVSEPEAPTYVHITNFAGKKDIAAQPSAIVNSTALATSTTAAYLGRVYITGRVAIAGTAQKLVYRLLDANGNQIQGWQELDYYGSNNYTVKDVTEGTAHLATAQKFVPEVTNVYEYVGLANLTAFPGQTVTVEFALVLDGVEGEDAYHTFATFKNVTNTESAS